jgi:hypothetical protein
MKLTSEEIKRLIFEADTNETKQKTDEKKKPADDTEGDIEDDPEETQTAAGEKQTEEKSEKSEEADSADNQSDDSQGEEEQSENNSESEEKTDENNNNKSAEEKPGDIKSELTEDGWDIRDKDGITYFLKRTDDSNVFYILNFSKLFSESKFLAKIRELILEEDEDNGNTTCILELVNTDTGIAYGQFTLETANNYVEIKKAIAEKAKEVVDSNWSEEFADKEFANVSGMTKLLASAYNKEKTDDSAGSENEDKPTETDKENSDNKEEQSADGEKQEEHSEKYIVDKINEAFSKLTEDEQNAFEVIYGDKLINKIQGK